MSDIKPYFSNLELPTTLDKYNLVRWYLKCEDDCIKYALKAYLKRNPTKKDYNKFLQMMVKGRSDRYNISYKGVVIGVLQHHYDNLKPEGRIGVEFIPNTELLVKL